MERSDRPRPHILLIGGDGGYSGVPTYLEQVAKALEGQARLTILSDVNRGGYDFARQAPGMTHAALPGLATSLSPLRWWRAARGLARRIETERPDLVWAHARMGVLLLRLVAARRARRGQAMPPVAVTFHGLPFDAGHRRAFVGLSVLAERALLRRAPAHHLVFLTRGARARYRAAVGSAALRGHQTHVLSNCSHLGEVPRSAGPDRAARHLLMAGRAGFQKNHAAAAALMAHLPESYHLTLCGDGTDSDAMRALFARSLGAAAAQARIHHIGPVADIRPLLAEADAFLLTSRYEGMPIAALEAFEAGLPLALTDIPGTGDILAAHPMAAPLPPADMAKAAARTEALVEAFRADPAAAILRIRAAWAARFSYDAWKGNLQSLVARMTAPMR